MTTKKTGFGTRSGFALAAAGSAVGLGNLWGFPYKVSANGGSAYLFVYMACIVLIGAVVMTAEFAVGRYGKGNAVTVYRKVSPALGWAGLLTILVPFLIICYYYVLGGFALKFALNSYAGNAGNFHTFAANYGDLILHSFIFALVAYLIVAAGVRGGIEKTSKILMPTVLFFLIILSVISLMLGEGVKEGVAYYLKPDFSELTASAVLSALGHAFFSLSLGCGVMVAYGSYSGEKFSLGRVTAAVCVIDILISLLMGFAVFPAVFHYSAVTGVTLSELGLGDFSLMFVTMSRVLEDIPVIGGTVSLLFFSMAAIAAVTSVISILEVVTQFIIQCFSVCRAKAAVGVSIVCFALSVPVAFSLGASLNGHEIIAVGGRNLFVFLDSMTNTLLMPVCALLACAGAARLIKRDELCAGRFFRLMVCNLTPALIIVIEILGVLELIKGSAVTLVTALAAVIVCAAAYFAFLLGRETGCNADEPVIEARAEQMRRAGLPRGWTRPESEDGK